MENVCYKSWKLLWNNVIWHNSNHFVHFRTAIQRGLWTYSPYLVWRQMTTLAKQCGSNRAIKNDIANVDVSLILLISNDDVKCPKFFQVTSTTYFIYIDMRLIDSVARGQMICNSNDCCNKQNVLQNWQGSSTQTWVSYMIMHYEIITIKSEIISSRTIILTSNLNAVSQAP